VVEWNNVCWLLFGRQVKAEDAVVKKHGKVRKKEGILFIEKVQNQGEIKKEAAFMIHFLFNSFANMISFAASMNILNGYIYHLIFIKPLCN